MKNHLQRHFREPNMIESLYSVIVLVEDFLRVPIQTNTKCAVTMCSTGLSVLGSKVI